MIEINLIYFKDKSPNGNFGDELSKFITFSLINKKKYKLIFRKKNKEINLICIGTFMQKARDNYFIYGTGVRLPENLINYKLNVKAVRGLLTKQVLEKNGIAVPDVFGDPGLLIKRFYNPVINPDLKNKIGIVPHKTNIEMYKDIKDTKYIIINPLDKWKEVVNSIYSCRCIISASLHGLVTADAYNIPNLWLYEFKLKEGEFKFKDYFSSQGRPIVKIEKLKDFDEKLLYRGGNKVDLDKLIKNFPFR
jgi:pyruvyltransferase